MENEWPFSRTEFRVLYFYDPFFSSSSLAMQHRLQAPLDDPPCPMGFVIVPAFIGALIWLCVLLHAMP